MADCRIDAAIIGVQKAGTTSLLRWLGQHPAILAQRSMEFTYFIDRERFEEISFQKAFAKGFPRQVLSETTTLLKHVGLFENEPALRLLKQHNPAVKLIVVLREPADRAWSAFWYAQSRGIEPESEFKRAAFERPADHFSSPFLQRSTDYVGRGFYSERLNLLEKIFPAQQICIISFESLRSDPQGVCNVLFRFLGLPPHAVAVQHMNKTGLPRYRWLPRLVFFFKPLIRYVPDAWRKPLKKSVRKLNQSGQSIPEMPEDVRVRLNDIYRESKQSLFEQYGIDYR